jgi:large exoprotein involved in heme utilization and adhesion
LTFDTSGSGNARGIRIQTGQLVAQNGGQVKVSGTGTGSPGNIDVTADAIFLNNKGHLTTETTSAEGGNIRLQARDEILMRYNSLISASSVGSGNGGNIEIESPNGLVLAVLSENSDIVASANQGNGGKVNATAAGVFGFRQFRDLRTPESDFTASSELGIDGTVEINTREQRLEVLPEQLVDTRIAQGCQALREQEPNKFVITGRGGLPDNPSALLSTDAVWTDLRLIPHPLVTRSSSQGATRSTNSRVVPLEMRLELAGHFQTISVRPRVPLSSRQSQPTTDDYTLPLVEANGWAIDERGKVVLTATPPIVIPHSPALMPAACLRS